jgi:hypothetical protein
MSEVRATVNTSVMVYAEDSAPGAAIQSLDVYAIGTDRSLKSGDFAGGATQAWALSGTVGAGPVVLDLLELPLERQGCLGSVTFKAIKILSVRNSSSAGAISIGPAQAKGWAAWVTRGAVSVPAQESLTATALASGWAVGVNSSLVEISGPDGSTFDIVLAGT